MGQTTQGLQNDGQTAHYQISYESSLSAADGLTRAQQLFHQCEFDFNLMSSWFPGVNFEFSFPISVQINNASGGASWNDPPNIALPFGYNPTVQINPGSGTDVNFVRYLLVSEVTEMFMASKNNGWFEDASLFSGANEGSKGEGLSRFLGFQFKAANGLQNVRYTGFEVVNFWLNSSRPNNVDVNPDDINPDIVTGCTTCFLYYLHNQLGFSIVDIINAGADNLGSVYRNLTGKSDGWQSFINLVNLHYPPGPTYNPAGDNIFPVPNLANLGSSQIESGSAQSQRILSLDTQAPAEVAVFISSDNPAVLGVGGTVNFPVGDWAAGVNLQAAPVTGPAQTVNIHATYAGKTLTAPIQITPRASIMEGQVTDTSFRAINDATILIESDTIILPGTGNTLQLSTDANGFYQSPAIPPHTYTVNASASAYVPGTATVTVGEGVPVTRQDFALPLTKPFIILGKVTDSASAAPIAGATVTLDQNSPVPGRIQVTADSSGNYTVSMNPGPYNGTFTVTASNAGYVSSSVTLTIPNGATITENLALAALGSLTGFVGDASQLPTSPVAGARITVGQQIVVTDASGRYTLTGLTPGANDVKLTASGFDSEEITVTVVSGVTTIQNFILVESSATMTGTVTDSDAGNPLPNATIRVGGLTTKAARDGTYKITGIPAGSQQVTVSAPLHFTDNSLIQFQDHQVLQMDFPLDSTRKPVELPGGPVIKTAIAKGQKAAG
jgi:hypothetical protein